VTKEIYGGEQHDLFPSLAHYCPFAIHSCIVRKALIEEVGGFDTSFRTCGDWDLWQRVARTGAVFQMVKETMAFYNTTSGSLSSDGNQFCINGLQVISQAYTFDPRVQHPKPEYANGLQGNDLVNRKYYFITWSAGLLIGASKNADHLLTHVEGEHTKNLDAHLMAETLLDSAIIPAGKEHSDWHKHWTVIEEPLKNFLNHLENQIQSKGFAEQVSTWMERKIITENIDPVQPLQIGKSVAVKIDIEESLQDLYVSAEHFFGIIQLRGHTLGIIELEVSNNFLPVAFIKDEIATKFSWQILRHFFSMNVYPALQTTKDIARGLLIEDEVHDKIGWEIFLQQVWRRPGWTETMFYDPLVTEKQKPGVIKAGDEVHIEISEELPTLKTRASELKIIYYTGGVRVGETLCHVRRRHVSPQMLRAAINLHSGYELCRIVVREALIGQKLDKDVNFWKRLR